MHRPRGASPRPSNFRARFPLPATAAPASSLAAWAWARAARASVFAAASARRNSAPCAAAAALSPPSPPSWPPSWSPSPSWPPSPPSLSWPWARRASSSDMSGSSPQSNSRWPAELPRPALAVAAREREQKREYNAEEENRRSNNAGGVPTRRLLSRLRLGTFRRNARTHARFCYVV